jgi:hypothetical protein
MQVEKNHRGSGHSLGKICGTHSGGTSDISLGVHLSAALGQISLSWVLWTIFDGPIPRREYFSVDSSFVLNSRRIYDVKIVSPTASV